MADISRREFVKTSGKYALLAGVPLLFRSNPLLALTGPVDDNLSSYLDHFGVTEKVMQDVMNTALSRGGDFADLYFEHSISSTLAMSDDAVNRAYGSVDLGVGIRVVEGDQVGYSFTEEITPKAMQLAAATAAGIASESATRSASDFTLAKQVNYYPVEVSWEDIGVEKKIPLMTHINDRATAGDPRVAKTRVYLSDSTSYVMVVRSDGRIAIDKRPMVSVYSIVSAEADGRKETDNANYAGRAGIEVLTEERLNWLADESVARTIRLFDAVSPGAGEMPVVLAPGTSGILLHEAMGHGFEADFNRKGTSIFCDKMGQKVAEDFVTIVDDGTNANRRGSLNVDDEGNPTQHTVLIENGKLVSYMHDEISARHYGVAPTGNGRRESFRYKTIPRMRNTYMLAGPHSRDEILSSVKNGIYCETFSNGEVRIGAGDFTFYLKSGYLIEDGKLTAPIKDVNLIGNGPDALSKITMVANDLELMEGGGTCGKDGQGVPVSFGLPTTKVSAITVGGVS